MEKVCTNILFILSVACVENLFSLNFIFLLFVCINKDTKRRMLLIQMNEHTIHMTIVVIYVVLQHIGNGYVRYQYVNFHLLVIAKMMMLCCWKMVNILWYALIVMNIWGKFNMISNFKQFAYYIKIETKQKWFKLQATSGTIWSCRCTNREKRIQLGTITTTTRRQ